MDVNFICLPDKNLAHPGITLVQNDISAIYNALFILSTNSFTVQCFFLFRRSELCGRRRL